MADKRIIDFTEAASAGADYYLVTDSASDGVKKIKPANILPAYTGDVTSTAGGTVNTIAANAVTNAKAAQMAAGTIKANLTGALANASDNTINAVMDAAFGSTQGAIAYRGASGWASLAPGVSGQFMQTSGPSANPIWQAIPGGGNMLSTNYASEYAGHEAEVRANIAALGFDYEVTDPAVNFAATTFLNGGDPAVVDKTATAILSILGAGSSLSPQLRPAQIVQQIITPDATGSGAAGAIVGGTLNRKNGSDAYGILGIINNTNEVPNPGGAALWAIIRGERAGSFGLGYVDGLRATAEQGHAVKSADRTVTVTIATPGVFTLASHGFIAGDQVAFKTTGALPTGVLLAPLNIYFVSSAGLTTNTFQISTTQANATSGVSVATSGTQSGTHSVYSPQNARSGLYISNNLYSNPMVSGVIIIGALQSGVQVGTGGTGSNNEVHEPTYPFTYLRRNGSNPFFVAKDGSIHTTTGLIMDANTAGITWTSSANDVGVDFGNSSWMKRLASDGSLALSSQSGLVNLVANVGLRVGSTTLLSSSVALTNGAAGNSATMTNAPAAGNPTKWVPINDNGTTRYIPTW